MAECNIVSNFIYNQNNVYTYTQNIAPIPNIHKCAVDISITFVWVTHPLFFD